ncbi:putative ribonuclease H-like domain-containing protein [Tanacetum coccineum]
MPTYRTAVVDIVRNDDEIRLNLDLLEERRERATIREIEHVSLPTEEQETPSFTNKQVKNPRETVKNQFTHSKNPKVDKKGWDMGLLQKHVLMRKKSSQREIRPIWNNVQRMNHRDQFVPKSVLTRTGKIPVNTARASGTISGCYRHMTGNKAYLAEYQDFNGGPVAFGGSKGYITGKGKIKIGKLDFEDVCFVKELQHFNLFKNFKNLNKLVKGNLVRGLPSKIFQNDHTCVACQKGKQHKASCKAKSVSSISQPLQLLHMDLFRPTSVRSLNHKTYCLVITDDFSRFSWVFFLRTKDETSGILKDFIRQIKNQFVTPPKIIQRSGIPLGVLLHNTQR